MHSSIFSMVTLKSALTTTGRLGGALLGRLELTGVTGDVSPTQRGGDCGTGGVGACMDVVCARARVYDCVCMCVCICGCVCVSMNVCTFVNVCMFVRVVGTFVRAHVCLCRQGGVSMWEYGKKLHGCMKLLRPFKRDQRKLPNEIKK